MKRSTLVFRLAAAMIAVSFGAILIRFSSEASPLAIAAWRLSLAALILAPAALLRRGQIRCPTRRETAWSALSGLALALHFILWIASLQATTVARSVLFVSTHPLFVAAGSVLLFRERLSRRLLLGGVLALAGGALIMGLGGLDAGNATLRGDLLALGGGAAAGVYLMIGQRIRRTLPWIDYAGMSYSVGAGIVLASAAITGAPLVGFSMPTYGFLVLLALVPQLIGHTTFNWALEHLSASRVSVLILGEPVGAAILAFLFFGETITWLNGIGAAIILVGIYLSLHTEEGSHGHDERSSQD